jgi:hypothetical protein
MQNMLRLDVMYTKEILNESLRMKSHIVFIKQVLNKSYENHTYTWTAFIF